LLMLNKKSWRILAPWLILKLQNNEQEELCLDLRIRKFG
jgi:hypothetical protein